ncbi:extracellular catalytic domain type 1 short-chain-length polyhydroxyalkanoate depolymerase [Pseudoalteromonas denitrificans]|uniref:Esterase, PHB depolymerase family n=1 Tax=Pseudoalteromonas denitrificans DSM 6059 TaxID=1123010 RepID=A0A1I1QGJ3_9GAMM|nr:PHB depolymerase family esterase [Pseudoalteromonas denitrificans]SFD21117.1 esterase, PHB depolymerase family [Pseudoalteromonas denitrificans DSM 6059]
MKLFISILINLFGAILFIPQSGYAAYKEISQFGANPGQLKADIYLPQSKSKNLVVLLHGCTQKNKLFAKQSGFEDLAENKKFLLLVPQQIKSNNINNCFNWFTEQDTTKNAGESLSLYNMIHQIKYDYQIEQINILGLSAGGAMVSVMLNNYPRLFNNAAIIAGLPYGCANTLDKALSCMKSGPKQSIAQLTALMSRQHNKDTKWPNVSIWYGNKDKTVNPINSTFMAQQWVKLYDNKLTKSVQNKNQYQTMQWRDPSGKIKVQLVRLNQLTHGMPVKPNLKGTGGVLADYVLQSPIASGIYLTELWGL